MAWYHALAQDNPLLDIQSFGRSAEGRDLLLLVLATDGAFTPAAAQRSGKPIVLIQAAIHPGENEGKDALMALTRALTLGSQRALLDTLTVLLIPIFNVDGDERFGPYHRVNQNGPAQMGWRSTAQNLNLNRDFMKADAPEMQAWLRNFHRWQPDLLIDLHNSNGADYQYPITWAHEISEAVHPAIAAWQHQTFDLTVMPAMEKKGWPVHPYISLVDHTDIRKGILEWAASPRFSTGYAAIAQRAGLLVETHMLKDFRTRTEVNIDLLSEILQAIADKPDALRAAVAQAERDTQARSATTAPELAVTFQTAESNTIRPFLGVADTREHSDISGATWVRYDPSKPVTLDIPVRDQIETTLRVAIPAAYLVPAAWHEVIDRLTLHGLRTRQLATATSVRAQQTRFTDVKLAARSFEGRQQVVEFNSERVDADVDVPAGSVLIVLDQPMADIAVHLLEPDAPDSLLRWGLFNTIFEEKEYAEPRVLEVMARKMLAEQPELQAAFDRALEDPAFASSPSARLNFFYARSPYYDARLNLYPVLRLDAAALKALQPAMTSTMRPRL